MRPSSLTAGLLALLLAACGESGNPDSGTGGMVVAPHHFLPGPDDCPPSWSYVSHSVEDGTVFVANYKRRIDAKPGDYVTVRVELGSDIPAAVANYQLSRHRFQQRGDIYLETIDALGERSATLTAFPRRILFQRANAVLEVEAERLGESALAFALLIDRRLQACLTGDKPARGTGSSTGPITGGQAPPP